jgi:hypothetical protein
MSGRIFSVFSMWNKELIEEWKLAVESNLVELHAFRLDIATIQDKYFNGNPVLLSDLAEELAVIIADIEKTVVNFNESVADKIEACQKIDLESWRQNAGKVSHELVAYIVDMAKVEALDCLEESDAARDLAERYL